jgi:lipopolysaccharide export system permease protein
MNVISRYLTSLFLKHLGLCLVGFLTLFLVMDFIEKISDFLYHKTPISTIILYFSALLPNVVVLLTPVATLASVLITLVLLARNSEIVAFKGSGVSLWRLSRPLVVTGLAISFLIFLIGNLLTPITSAVTGKIWDEEIRNRRPQTQLIVNDVWTRDIRLLEHLDSYNEETGEAEGLSILVFDDNLNISKRIEAEKGRFVSNGLSLQNTSEKEYHGLNNESERYFSFKRSAEIFLKEFPTPPPGLGKHSETNSDELNVWALSENIRLLEAEGFNPVKQLVDLHFKFSRPLIVLVMIIVGIPIGFWREKGGSIALGLVLGLSLSFVYLVTLELSRTMGYAMIIPPFLAAWLPNVFFLFLGLYLFSYVRQ